MWELISSTAGGGVAGSPAAECACGEEITREVLRQRAVAHRAGEEPVKVLVRCAWEDEAHGALATVTDQWRGPP